MKLYLSGCGGLHHMMFGACSYIEEHYDLDKIKEIRSISGGNYVAAALLSNYSTRSIWELWSKRLSALIKDYPLTFLFKFYGMISKHSDDILQKLSAKEQLKQYSITQEELDQEIITTNEFYKVISEVSENNNKDQ